jgi:hypothetical protein
MFRFRAFLVLTLAMIAAACSSGDSVSALQPTTPSPPPPPPPPPVVTPADVSGAWYSRIENNLVNCGLSVVIDAQASVISQDDTAITILTSGGNTYSGTVNGDIVEWSGSFDERGGTTTLTASVIVSGDSASGNATWDWTDGTDSCNGTMEITADQNWAVAEADVHNSQPGTGQLLDYVDGVAFVTASLNLPTDVSDGFALTFAADVTLRAELSHFNAPTSDLDLTLIDEDLNEIAVSASVDSFEWVVAELTGGVTYYLTVTAVTTDGEEAYTLSTDVN